MFKIQYELKPDVWVDSSDFTARYEYGYEAEQIAEAVSRGRNFRYRSTFCDTEPETTLKNAARAVDDTAKPAQKPARPIVFLRPQFIPNLPPGPYTVVYKDKDEIGEIRFREDKWQYYFIPVNYLMYDQKSLEAITAEVRKLNETLIEKECS